jgi:hypothetical protein
MKKYFDIAKKQVVPYSNAIRNDKYLWITLIGIFAGALIAWKAALLLLALVSMVQNMAFTASSRSRNSGNPPYHYQVATISNSIWFVTSFFLILDSVQHASFFIKVVTMIVYTLSTSYGSMLQMEVMLNKEDGKNKVGATKQ